MQDKAVYLLLCKFNPHVSGVQRGKASLAMLEGGSCTTPEAVVTVLCTPDDGCG